MFCMNCGNELSQGDKFCQSCGSKVELPPQTEQAPPSPEPPPEPNQVPPPSAPPVPPPGQVYYAPPPGQVYAPHPQQSQPAKKPKKKLGCLIALISGLLIVGLIVVLIIVLLPGLFGPKNLGIKTSKKAYESAVAKLNYTKDKAPTKGNPEDYVYAYGEVTDVDTTLTSEEITSFFNYNRPKYYALKKVQVRVNRDNTVEFSGAIETKYFLDKIIGDKYSEEEIKKAFPMINSLPKSVNIYAKAAGEIQDNQAMGFAFKDIEIMGFGMPDSLYKTDKAKEAISNLLNDALEFFTEKTQGTFSSIKVVDGELQINGQLPSSLTREEVN